MELANYVNQGDSRDAASREQLRLFVDEMTRTYHELAGASDQLHRGRQISTSLRSILTSLHRAGPATMSQLARSRRVSRQFVQRVVNDLVKRGLAAEQTNPKHRSSPFIVLSDDGEALVAQIEAAEHIFWQALSRQVDPGDIEAAMRVLNSISRATQTPPAR